MRQIKSELWDVAERDAVNSGLLGLVKSLKLTSESVDEMRDFVGGMVSNLFIEVNKLNTQLSDFNKSSSELAQKASNLTWWIMWATIISSFSTAIIAVDTMLKWFNN